MQRTDLTQEEKNTANKEWAKVQAEKYKVSFDEARFLAASGGGAGGLSFAAFAWQAARLGLDFGQIEGVIGTSIGSVFALAVTLMKNTNSSELKLTPLEMFKRLASIDFRKVKDAGDIFHIPERLWSQQRLYKGAVIFQHILEFLRDETERDDPANITFKDLKEMGYPINLCIILTELLIIDGREGYGEKVVCSYETTPNAPVAWAIRASTAALPYFPGIGFKVDKEGKYIIIPPGEKDPEARYFVDGGAADNFGLKYFDFNRYIHPEAGNHPPVEPENELNRQYKPHTEVRRFENPMRVTEEKWGEEDDRRTQPVCNPYTLGVTLHWPANARKESLMPGKPFKEAQAHVNTFLDKSYNEMMGDKQNYYRTIRIPRVISLTDFDIGPEKQKEVLKAGIRTACEYCGMSEEEIEAEYNYFLENCYYQCFPRPEEIAEQAAKAEKEAAFPFSSLKQSEHWMMFGTPIHDPASSAGDRDENEKDEAASLTPSNCVFM